MINKNARSLDADKKVNLTIGAAEETNNQSPQIPSSNKASDDGNDLVLDNYVNTAISNVRVLKRVPKDSRVPLAESLSDKINDIVYNVEDVTKWLIFITSFLFFWSNPKEVDANRPQA